MKTARRLLLVLAVAAAGVAVVTVAGFIPAVQRWTVLRMIPLRPGTELGIEELAVRPGSIVVRNLDFAWPGGRLRLADGAAKLSVWDLLAHRRANVTDARLTGLKIVLSRRPVLPKPPAVRPAAPSVGPDDEAPQPAATEPLRASPAAAGPKFEGVFRHLRLPLALTLGACRVEAEIVYPQRHRQAMGEGRVTLTGGHLGPGADARFEFEATFRNPDPGARVDTVETRGSLTATLGRQASFERLGAQIEAVAHGPRLPAPARLQAEAALTRSAGGETYTLSLQSAENGTTNQLLGLNVDYAAGASLLTGTWQIRANDSQIAPFTLGVALPQFAATGDGRFEFTPSTLATRLAGRLGGEFSRLEVIDPRLRDLNGLGATADFDLDYDGANLRVAAFSMNLEGRRPLLALQAIQPFTLALASHRLSAADPAKELARVTMQGVPASWLQPWLAPSLTIGGGELTGTFDAELHEERVRFRTAAPATVRGFTLTRDGRVLLPASDLELQAEMEYTKGETWLKLGQLTLATTTGDHLEAHAEMQLKRDGPAGSSVRADFDGTLPTLLASWVPGVPLSARGSLAVSRSGNLLQVDGFTLAARSTAGQPLAELSTSRAFRIDLATGNVAPVADGDGELARVKLGRIPLGVLAPYCGAGEFGGELEQGELAFRSEAGRLQAATTAPWTIGGFSAAVLGHPLAKDLAIEIEAAGADTPAGVTARITALRARTADNSSLLTAQAEVEMTLGMAAPWLNGSASFDLAVPALAGQPVLGGLVPPKQGRLSGEVKFSLDRDLLGEGRLTLNGLVVPATGTPLPVANLSFRTGLSDKGDVALQLPLLLDRAGERSDLTLAATLHPAAGGYAFDARLSSEHVVLDDLLALADTFTAPAADAAGADPTPEATARTPEAAWAGFTGQLALSLKSVAYGPITEVTGLSGRIVVDPERVVAEQVGGRVGADGQILATARIDFSADEPQPYMASADLNVQDLEVGPYFKAAVSDRAPTLEGRFNLRCKPGGTGHNLVELLRHMGGEVLLQSRKGVFRGLVRPPPPPPRSGIVGGAARVLSDLGEKVGNLVVSPDAEEALAGQLAAIQYDQLNVRLTRDPAQNLRLLDFTLVSPVLRLQGDGLITREAGKGVLNQPLQLRSTMSVMGAVENSLSHAKSSLVPGERDDLGYLKLRDPITVGGTAARPDSSQFYSMISRSLLDLLHH